MYAFLFILTEVIKIVYGLVQTLKTRWTRFSMQDRKRHDIKFNKESDMINISMSLHT